MTHAQQTMMSDNWGDLVVPMPPPAWFSESPTIGGAYRSDGLLNELVTAFENAPLAQSAPLAASAFESVLRSSVREEIDAAMPEMVEQLMGDFRPSSLAFELTADSIAVALATFCAEEVAPN